MYCTLFTSLIIIIIIIVPIYGLVLILFPCRQKLTISHLQAQLHESEARSSLQLASTMRTSTEGSLNARLRVRPQLSTLKQCTCTCMYYVLVHIASVYIPKDNCQWL